MSRIASTYSLEEEAARRPLALRQHEVYFPCRSGRGANGAWSYRSSSGHVGPFDLADPRTRSPTRLGRIRTRAAAVERRSSDTARVALSRPASFGAPWLDQSAMGRIRQKPAREILRTHEKRASAA